MSGNCCKPINLSTRRTKDPLLFGLLLNRQPQKKVAFLCTYKIFVIKPFVIDFTCVYRPMGDLEISYLVETGSLPNTQPYQAIIEGETGRTYAEKYLNGRKKVDTEPSTVVEFICPKVLIKALFERQHK